MTSGDPARALLAAAAALVDARKQLGELDAIAGDGDLGSTLAAGFTAVRDDWADLTATSQPGDWFDGMGRVLARTASSTLGTLLAMGFRRAGRDLAGLSTFDSTGLAVALAATAAEIGARGGATTGERTVLDALVPAATAAQAAAEQDESLAAAAAAAAKAAETGAVATRQMTASRGRAAWLADRAHGHPDAGAVAIAIWLRSFASALAEPGK